MFFVLVFIFLAVGIVGEPVCPEDGFQFDCGLGMCTYPDEYCDDGGCKYCNSDVCNSENVPRQCRRACADFQSTGKDKATVSAGLHQKTTRNQTSSDNKSEKGVDSILLKDKIFVVVLGVSLGCNVITVVAVIFKCKRQSPTQQRSENNYEQVPQCHDGIQIQNDNKSSCSTDSGFGKDQPKNEQNQPLIPTAPPHVTEDTFTLRDIHASPEKSDCSGNHERPFDCDFFPKQSSSQSEPGRISSEQIHEHVQLKRKCESHDIKTVSPEDEGTSSQNVHYICEQKSANATPDAGMINHTGEHRDT